MLLLYMSLRQTKQKRHNMNFENKIVTIKPVTILIVTKSNNKFNFVITLSNVSMTLSQGKLLYESLILAQDERWRRA